MEGERIIYSGRWSTGYKYHNIFIKEFVHYVPDAVVREMSACNAAYEYGILTPKCYGYSDDGRKLRLYYQFIQMNSIKIEDLMNYTSEILNTIQDIQKVAWNSADDYWRQCLIPDFYDALSYLGYEQNNILSLITSLSPEVFIHGDLSMQNMGIFKESLYIYDFQHGCLGPKNWDICYLAGSLNPYVSKNWGLTDKEKKVAYAVAGIKYGRALRKNANDKNLKQLIYHQWESLWN